VETDELLERDTHAEFLPFQTRHLLGLASAVSLVVFSQWLAHNKLPRAFLSPLLSTSIVYWLGFAVSSVIEANLLFVSAIALAWLRRYRHDEFWEPGHSMALRGSAAWLFTVLAYCAYRFALHTPIPRILAIVQIAGAIVFTLGFLWLGLFSRETKSWRRAYLLLAMAPALGAVASLANMWSDSGLGPPRSFRLMSLTQATVALVQAVGVVVAMTSDVRHKLPRHWSHWIAAIASLAGFALSAGAAVWESFLVSG
jgi:hypothetical protein